MTGALDPKLRPYAVSGVIEFLGEDVIYAVGSLDREISSVCALPSAAPGAITFCRYSDDRLLGAVRSLAEAVIIPAGRIIDAVAGGPTLIAVQNPRLAFIRIVSHLFVHRPLPGIHPTAQIDAHAEIDVSASIGPFVVIGRGCKVGPGSALGAHVVLQQDVHVGANTRIDAGTVVGAEGFGFERGASGELINFPHIGGVRIGDNVDIGCNVCIDRGTLENTVIEDGVRIDNLTHISHNCRIGKCAVVVCLASICGSTVLGEQSWVSPSASVLNQLTIGKRAFIGMGGVVVRDVADGETVVGNPAKPLPRKR